MHCCSRTICGVEFPCLIPYPVLGLHFLACVRFLKAIHCVSIQWHQTGKVPLHGCKVSRSWIDTGVWASHNVSENRAPAENYHPHGPPCYTTCNVAPSSRLAYTADQCQLANALGCPPWCRQGCSVREGSGNTTASHRSVASSIAADNASHIP